MDQDWEPFRLDYSFFDEDGGNPGGILLVAVRTVPPDQVRLIGSTGLDSGLVLAERSVKEWVSVLRDSGGGLLGTVLHTR